MSFLLDTDTCSVHLKGNRQVSSRFLQYSGQLHVSILTVADLYTWAKRRRAPAARLAAVREMLRATWIIDLNQDVAEEAGELRAALLDRGRPMPGIDSLIAATALLHGLTLVTHNTRHFQKRPRLGCRRLADHLGLQFHHLPVLGHGDVPAEVPADLFGQGQRGFGFAVGDEELAGRVGEMPQPGQERLAVGMAGKALNLRDRGPHQPRAAVDADLRGCRRGSAGPACPGPGSRRRGSCSPGRRCAGPGGA